MKASVSELMARIPGPVTKEWPQGERFVQALAHGSMSVELFAPRGVDPQTPHEQDELYFVHAGKAEFVVRGERAKCTAGDALFVAAGVPHHFESVSPDFATWIVFWGPKGGES